MDRRLNGTMFVAGTRTLYVGALVATKLHAHHAAQIVLAPRGLSLEHDERRHVHAPAAIIPPRAPHGHGACAHAALLFLDGDDIVSRELSRDAGARCETWVRGTIDVTVPHEPTDEQARALITSILSALDLRHRARPQHPAARRMCAYLDRGDQGDLARLAQEAGLSPRQMRHAFARDVGLSMRAYLRWRRLRRAIAAVEGGATLSVAAAAGGFADSAHLSRVFREQFGMTPSQGLAAVRWRALE